MRHSAIFAVDSGQASTVSEERHARLVSIFSQNYRFVWRLLRRLGVSANAVEDAAQQVFLVVAERLDDIIPGSERGFLYGTVLRVAWTTRRGGMHEVLSDSFDAHESPAPAPSELADQHRARDVLDRVLARMQTDLRAVFILYEIEGFTTPEIAETIGIPLGTAASRLRRARSLFKRLVARLMAQSREKK
ncbi:MAG TPA: sigma-70 family RNA polymerase sigma factor [Polyangiaceae bacterium]